MCVISYVLIDSTHVWGYSWTDGDNRMYFQAGSRASRDPTTVLAARKSFGGVMGRIARLRCGRGATSEAVSAAASVAT